MNKFPILINQDDVRTEFGKEGGGLEGSWLETGWNIGRDGE